MAKFMRTRVIGRYDKPYMVRFIFFSCKWFGIYAHVFLRDDDYLHYHNHPYTFVSYILQGRYWEERLVNGFPTGLDRLARKGWVRRGRNDFHKVKHVEYGTTTLIFRGIDHDNWGFLVDGEVVPWRTYVGED